MSDFAPVVPDVPDPEDLDRLRGFLSIVSRMLNDLVRNEGIILTQTAANHSEWALQGTGSILPGDVFGSHPGQVGVLVDSSDDKDAIAAARMFLPHFEAYRLDELQVSLLSQVYG